jgi:type I restriction enzyme R subunit
MAADNWKKMPDLHPVIREHLRNLLMPLAGWERLVSRDHAKRIVDILLKN